MAPPIDRLTVDHLVFATPDLDRTVAELAEQMAVRAAPGGRHVGRGTHNALVHLGGRTYLEIIGPDPSQDVAPGTPLPFRLELLSHAKLVWYAVACNGLTATAERIRAAGYDPGTIVEMQRARPDGVMLRWVLATHTEVPDAGAVPFLIDWLDSPHPSADSPRGCTLRELTITHPDAPRVRRHLDVLGVDLVVTDAPPGASGGLTAIIDTPAGRIQLQ